jgi:short-subunit dehydrogenase
MTAEQCAKQIVQALKAKKTEVNIGGKELKALWLKRFFPSYFSKRIAKAKVT